MPHLSQQIRLSPLLLLFAATLLPAGGIQAAALEPKSGLDSGSCLSCHEEIIAVERVHEPAADEAECTVCHEPSEKGGHSFAPAPQGADLCFQCHASEDFEGESVHPPALDGECVMCHNPHGSDNKALLSAPVADLCFRCHDAAGGGSGKGGGSAGGKNAGIASRWFPHAPFSDGDCTECHMPHASENNHLLIHNYPDQLYSPYDEDIYEICLKCHSDLRDSLSKLRDASGTEFRNGDLNLHFVHVNKTKGRTCWICHQHHESTNRQLIRQTLPFGKKLLDMGYEQTQNGGMCTVPCHFPVKYDRSNPTGNPMIKITAAENVVSNSPQPIEVVNTSEHDG